MSRYLGAAFPCILRPMNHMSLRVTLCTVLAVIVCAQGLAAEITPAQARAALEKWFAAAAKVKTVQADFEQLRKLKSVRTPLRKQGRMWMDKKSALFRWQIGDPPEVLAIRGRDGGMTVFDSKKKEAYVWSREALEAEEKQGRGQGFAMLNSMQNASLADFDKGFELAAWKTDATNPDLWHFDWKFRDGTISLFVLRLAVTVNTSDGSMHAFTLHMRDGSSMGTVIRSHKLNESIPVDIFKADTNGYKVEQMTSKP